MKLKNSDNHTIARSVLAFVIVLVAFGILVLFNFNKDTLVDSNNYKPFMFLVVVGMSFMVILLFLASQSTAKKKR